MNLELLAWAMQQNEVWQTTVVACFIDDANTYYEECIDLPPLGPVVLAEYAGEIEELVQAALTEARKAGNPTHYVDSAMVLRLHTKQSESIRDDDQAIKQQAAERAEYIFDRILNKQIQQLTMH